MTLIDLAHQTGIKPLWVATTAGGEYHSACPKCGGTDRFFIQPYRQMKNCLGSYHCRQCGTSGDAIQFAREFLNCSFPEAVELTNATPSKFSPFHTTQHTHTYQPVSLRPPPEEWIKNATDFINQTHRHLVQKDTSKCTIPVELLKNLENRGLPLEAAQHYKLGWSEKDQFVPRASWGLEEPTGPGKTSALLWLPSGLVIPTIEPSGKVIRLKVRRYNWTGASEDPKYVAIPGSMNGLIILGPTDRPVMVVVESELDAYAVHFAAHDFAFVVAVGGNIKGPDIVTNRLAQKTQQLLICHDNDEGGVNMFTKWKKLYPHAISFPTTLGKDIGEAAQQGLNIREWLLGIVKR